MTAVRSSWQDVYDQLAAGSETLDAGGLEALADAAFWTGRPRESISARQRAYQRHRDAGDAGRSAMTAWRLFHSHFDLDETAAASGWLARARRHARDLADGVETGYVALADADWALYDGRPDEAVSHARRASDTGAAHGDRDLEALGLAVQGRAHVARGDAAEGLDRLDEAMVAVLGDELTPFSTGWIYCMVLYTCHEIGDVRRAAEWTNYAVRWSEDRGEYSWYPGLCRLHRCEMQSLRGEWSAAEQEIVQVAEALASFGDYYAADAHYLTGEIRCRRGDYAGAEEAFRRAHELGRDPQPGLALLRLSQGDADAAAAALRSALAGTPSGPLRRGRLLAAHVQAELRLGHLGTAEASAKELADLAAAGRTLLLRALAAAAQGSVLLARDAVDAALPLLREAADICRELSCPYDAAQARVLLGTAARRQGDEETARLELEAARATFQRLGALPDAELAAALLARDTLRPRGLTTREVEVLKLLAQGRSNLQIAGALFISEHTVARHLSNIFRKLGVSSRGAATAFAHGHDLV